LQKIAEEPHDKFGRNLIDETWSLDFDSAGAVMLESPRRIEIFVKRPATPPILALEQPPL